MVSGNRIMPFFFSAPLSCRLHTPLILRHLGRAPDPCRALRVLGRWHQINEDAEWTWMFRVGRVTAEVWNHWAVKLPWQPCCCFSVSWWAAQLASLPLHIFPFHLFLSTHLYTLPYCARADLSPGLRVCWNYKAITDRLVLYAPLQGTVHYNFCLKATPESVKVFHIQT